MMSNRYSADMKTAEVFQEIEKRINENPKPVEGIESVYQFELSGDDGATYQLHLSNGNAKVVEGKRPLPIVRCKWMPRILKTCCWEI